MRIGHIVGITGNSRSHVIARTGIRKIKPVELVKNVDLGVGSSSITEDIRVIRQRSRSRQNTAQGPRDYDRQDLLRQEKKNIQDMYIMKMLMELIRVCLSRQP